jgi:hypothetical protein
MSDKAEYMLEFTPLAEQLAKRHYTLDAVKAEVCRDLDHNLANGLEHVDKLLFTTVCLGSFFDDSIPSFIVTPKGNSVLLVDAAEYEESDEPMDAGPFAGMKISIPTPDGRGNV